MAVSKRSTTKQKPVTQESVILSKLVANRAMFFALLDELELTTGKEIEPGAIQAELDAELPGRFNVSQAETQRVLRAVA